MSVVASWDFANRVIHMGVADWHGVDIYQEYRAYRASNESVRRYRPLLSYQGNLPKGGGHFTSRYLLLLEGTKIVPLDGNIAPVTNITGEVITDDQSSPISYAGLIIRPLVNYMPPGTEVIQTGGGGGSNANQVVDAIWASEIGLQLISQVAATTATLTGPHSPLTITYQRNRVSSQVRRTAIRPRERGRFPTNRGFKVYSCLDGAKFHGFLSVPPLSYAAGVSKRRMLLVKSPWIVMIGDVVISPQAHKLILMEYGEHTDGCESYQVAPVSDEYEWKRPTKALDAVAKVLKDTGYEAKGVIYASMIPFGDAILENMIVKRTQFITGQAIQLDDMVNGRVVQSIDPFLGVKLVTLK